MIIIPSVIFRVEQEVCANNRNATGHRCKYQEYQHHKAINVVDLVRPKRCKDKVHFDKDRAKR